ncbi:hypothetical protein [Rothia sp. P4278]|uniref:hypothetical protein n=1 Tax=Rothia sp. P4278 TaxID=3402658 RepID=UPI003AE5F32B
MNQKLDKGQLFASSALVLVAVIALLIVEWLLISALANDPVAVFTPVSVISATGLGLMLSPYLRERATKRQA